MVDFVTEALTPQHEPQTELAPDWFVPYANILRYTSSLNWDFFPEPGTLDFVPAGKQDSSYAIRVNGFNWQRFYDDLGGYWFLEAAKERMRAEYDYILIDSRTGVSDTAGICTVQLPDILVVCFTPNNQSIEGARAVAASVDTQRRSESGEPQVRIFPVLTRVETSEKEKLELAQKEVRNKFAPFLWHINQQEHDLYWGRVETAYVPFYAYEEILATFADTPRRTNSLLASIERITAYVTDQEVTELMPAPEPEREKILLQYTRRRPTPEPERLAILFADIAGSTRLYEVLDEPRARERVATCLSLLTEVIDSKGGTVIKTIGDEVMSIFPNVDLAVQTACGLQETLVNNTSPGQVPLSVRVGLHYGPVLREAGDVFGDAVNIAARIVGQAKPGQILTTRQTVDALALGLRANTRHIDRVAAKGKQEEIDIYEVIWRDEDVTFMGRDPVAYQSRMRLRAGNREVSIDQSRPVVTIGRSPQNDLVVLSQFASRIHARIEYRRGKFILFDQSTNGTFIRTRDGQEVNTRGEEFPLQGTGVISLGRSVSEESQEVIEFSCEV